MKGQIHHFTLPLLSLSLDSLTATLFKHPFQNRIHQTMNPCKERGSGRGIPIEGTRLQGRGESAEGRGIVPIVL